MKLKTILPVVCVWALAVMASSVHAQAPTAYKPGDLLTFTVRFEGESASKLSNAGVHLDLTTPVHDDQKAFITYLNVTGGQTKPGTFDTVLRIPDFIASGTYKLTHVNAGTPYVNFDYAQDLPDITITVDNSDHFAKPALKSVEKTSHP